MRRRSPWAALLLGVLLPGPARADLVELDVRETIELPFILAAPKELTADLAGQAQIAGLIDRLLAARTSLRARPREAADCLLGPRFRCWLQIARPDYNVLSPEAHERGDRGAPLLESKALVGQLRDARPAPPRHVLVLALTRVKDGSAAGARVRVTSVLIDTDAGLEAVHDLERRPPPGDRAQATEDAIVSRAVLANPAPAHYESDEPTPFLAWLERQLDTWFTSDYRLPLEQAGLWDAFGELVVESDHEDLQIELDGRVVGKTGAQGARLTGLLAGEHRLAVSRPDLAPRTEGSVGGVGMAHVLAVRVVAKQATRVRLAFEQPQPLDPQVWRPVAFWTGVAASAAGAAVITYSVRPRSPQFDRYCFYLPSSDPSAAPSQAQCTSDFESTVGFGRADSGRGDKLLAGGVALGAFGASLLTSTLLLDQDSLPWLEALISVGVGLASGGVVIALRPYASPATTAEP